MALSQIGSSYDNAFCVSSSALNSKIPALNAQSRTNGSSSAYYAKKGEPMYMKEMDADEDGIVSFDEFKDYCKNKGISSNEMEKMVQMGSSYRELVNQIHNNNEKNTINSISDQTNELLNKINSKNDNKSYAVRGDDKYNEAMDSNNDGKVTYKEYIDYCLEHVKNSEQKSNTRAERTENGEFKATSYGKAVNAYARAESQSVQGMYEYEV